MVGWSGGQMVGWLSGWVIGWLVGWVVGWSDGQVVGWSDGWVVNVFSCILLPKKELSSHLKANLIYRIITRGCGSLSTLPLPHHNGIRIK